MATSTAETDTSVPTAASPPVAARTTRRGRRRWVRATIAIVVLTTIVGGVVVARDLVGGDPTGEDGQTDAAPGATGTALAEVQQRAIAARVQVDGTIGYAGNHDVVNLSAGTVTNLPAIGQVLNQGDVLYRVDGRPVLLVTGGTPAWRELAAGATAAAVAGPDVQQLNAALVALGYAEGLELDPASDQFSWITRQAIKNLQKGLGVAQTGKLALGDVVFLPGPVRVTALPVALGTAAPSGGTVIEATSTTPLVTVALPTARRAQVHPGDAVEVMMPDLTTAAGTVWSVGTVAAAGSAGSAATIPVEIALTDPAAAEGLDQAPVLVAITTASVDSALVVPVTALLALAGGGYAVEIEAANGVRSLVTVELGIFDDAAGVVQVTGAGLAVGQRVVVPAT